MTRFLGDQKIGFLSIVIQIGHRCKCHPKIFLLSCSDPLPVGEQSTPVKHAEPSLSFCSLQAAAALRSPIESN